MYYFAGVVCLVIIIEHQFSHLKLSSDCSSTSLHYLIIPSELLKVAPMGMG